MPAYYPSINDRQFDLLKKIAYNTASLAGGGGGGGAAWGAITGTLSNQLDLLAALNLKVVGPASATDTAFALYDGTTGKLIKNGVVKADGSGNVTGVASVTLTNGVNLPKLSAGTASGQDAVEVGVSGSESGVLKANGGVHANGAVGVQTRNGDGSELHSWLRQDGTLNTVSGGGWMISGSASDASAAKILGLHRLDDDTLQLDNGTPGTFRDLKLRNLIASGDITTGAPSGGTAAAWKLGVKVDAVVVLDTAKYLQVDIAGVAYKVALAS